MTLGRTGSKFIEEHAEGNSCHISYEVCFWFIRKED